MALFGCRELIDTIWAMTDQGVDFINCFEPYADLLCLALNFCASKKAPKKLGIEPKQLGAGRKSVYEIDPRWRCVKVRWVICIRG